MRINPIRILRKYLKSPILRKQIYSLNKIPKFYFSSESDNDFKPKSKILENEYESSDDTEEMIFKEIEF